jgi:serine/threonine-protein kinase
MQSDDTSPSLCCGAAGRGYALLNLYRHTGEPEWLAAARRSVQRSLATPFDLGDPLHFSLYQGPLGLALLVEDLKEPEAAAMPMFEEEDE